MIKKLIITFGLFILLTVTQAFSQSAAPVTVAFVNSAELLELYPEKAAAAQQLLALSDNYKKNWS